MKYEVDYMQYHFQIESDLENNYESLKVLYRDILIIRVGFFRLWCSVGYNSEFIGVREVHKLDELFKSYRGDILKRTPEIIEVLCDEYVPEFVRIKSVTI